MPIYESWREASTAAQALNIKSASEYNIRYNEDSHLPKNPSIFYSLEWSEKGKWKGFLNIDNSKIKYNSWKSASDAAKKLGIRSSSDYIKKYRNDKLLPCKPKNHFAETWVKNGSWDGFLGREKSERYTTLKQASLATISLGISTYIEYQTRYKEDPKLPRSPDQYYHKEWHTSGKWNSFFGRSIQKKYESWELASNATKALGIKTAKEYRSRYLENPNLPSKPELAYAGDWLNKGKWQGFLSGITIPSYYKSFDEASKATKVLNIKSGAEYSKLYMLDSRLPPYPQKLYCDEWLIKGGMDEFLGKIKNYPTWDDAVES